MTDLQDFMQGCSRAASESMANNQAILSIEDLSVSFETAMGRVMAADGVCLKLHERETVALVGETGCGKSVVVSSIVQLLPGNASVRGRAIYEGRDLLSLGEKEMAGIRGSEIAMIFQNPSLALNPIIKAAEQIAEPVIIHWRLPKSQALDKAGEMLRRLGLGNRAIPGMFPFQLSGGMNQRVMIAAAMILSPKIIIADEPSKGLDANSADEVMGEIARLRDSAGASLLLITHDLGLARKISDRMAVMYCGQIIETGRCEDIFNQPLHPYTKALLNCLPQRGFQPIPGSSPSMIEPPEGCRFYPRCPERQDESCMKAGLQMVRILGPEGEVLREVRCRLY